MVPVVVELGHHIKNKQINGVPQTLVVKKEFCQVTQILTINAAQSTVNLKHRQVAITVYLVTRGMTKFTSRNVPLEFNLGAVNQWDSSLLNLHKKH